MADILEVVFAIANAKGISREELENIRRANANRRGAFDKKILLIEVNY